MRYLILIFFSVTILSGCFGFYSNMDGGALPYYNPEIQVKDKKLLIKLDCRNQFHIYKIDHRFRKDCLYLSAHSSSAVGYIIEFEIDLKGHENLDINRNIYWLNIDGSTELIGNLLIKEKEEDPFF